ncbi:hypothetical protein MTsPCn3_30490 [Erythrobacter sp. MTPC3]
MNKAAERNRKQGLVGMSFPNELKRERIAWNRTVYPSSYSRLEIITSLRASPVFLALSERLPLRLSHTLVLPYSL